jgi:hypothetical protein
MVLYWAANHLEVTRDESSTGSCSCCGSRRCDCIQLATGSPVLAQHASSQSIRLCAPRSASPSLVSQAEAVVRLRVDREFRQPGQIWLNHGTKCVVVHFNHPQSAFGSLVDNLKERGQLNTGTSVPTATISDTSSLVPPVVGAHVRYNTDPVTKRNKRLPVVRIVVPSSDIIRSSVRVTYDTYGNPLLKYSLNRTGSSTW